MATPQLSGSELDTAREAMRRLTYATTSLADPADSYALMVVLSTGLGLSWVPCTGPVDSGALSSGPLIGSLSGSVPYALDQLAVFHDRTADRATGTRTAGHHAATQASAALRDAAALTGRAEARVNAAWTETGSIVWQPAPARSRGLAGPTTRAASVTRPMIGPHCR